MVRDEIGFGRQGFGAMRLRERGSGDRDPRAVVYAALDAGIARTHDATPGQIALAWVHHRQHVHATPVVPLPGTTSVDHLRANVAAADLRLSDDELRRLDRVQA